jgi:UDP-glucuronate decarboxylase
MKNQIVEEDLNQIHSIIKHKGNWKDAVIVITGCAGFLGFYLMNYLVLKGSTLGIKKIIGLDNFRLGKPDWLTQLENNFSSLLVLKNFDISLNDISQVEYALEARYIIHGASIASPSFYRKFPIETIDANIWGLRKLLDCYKKKKQLKGFLFFSSSEIYGDPDLKSIPTNEEYRGNVSCFGPRACYDESKRFGETLCWVYAKQFKMPITIARPFNNYGPGMNLNDRRLPADLASQVIKGNDLVILSDGTPTRTFCYISDAIIGYFLCLTHGKYDYFNIGIDKPEIMIKDFAENFRKAGEVLFGYKGKVSYQKSNDLDYMTDNPKRRCPSINKAKQVLGYKPLVGVEEGVLRYLKFLKNETMENI